MVEGTPTITEATSRAETTAYAFCKVPSPIGLLTLTAGGQNLNLLTGLYMQDHRAACHSPTAESGYIEREELPIFDAAREQLEAYFAGSLREFSLPLLMRGTPFQRAAWQALLEVPYGLTATYGQQAAKINKPAAVRAIGLANSANPVSIIVPCHRVIGASGALTGYGGGIERKKWLLDHERSNAGSLFS